MSTVLEPPTSVAEPPKKYTPEDLLTITRDAIFELVDGELVEKAMSIESSWIGAVIVRKLGNFAEDKTQLGWVFGSDCGYQCFGASARKVRKPDVSFITREKLPERRFTGGYAKFAPDLAVEVISTHDTMEEVELKIEEYLKAGTRSVWVVHPRARVIDVYRHDGTVLRLRENDTLKEPDLLPDFVCLVKELLPLPDLTDPYPDGDL